MGIWNREYMRSGRGLLPEGWGPVQIIIALNVLVFIGWAIAYSTRSDFFQEHFTTSNRSIEKGYVWTVLTAAFSHKEVFHIFLNMFVLFMFGRAIEGRLGSRRFVFLYLGAAVFASLVHIGICYIKYPAPMLGASGAIAALVTLFAFYYPREKLYLFMVIPMPAWVVVALMGAFDLNGLFSQLQGGGSNIGHAAHLGGALYGVGYWFVTSHLGLGSGRRRSRRSRGSSASYSGTWQDEAEARMAEERQRQDRMREEDQQEMDRLLEQISRRGGYDKLPESEREVLEDLSRRLRKDK